jgi:hypothetical protein
MENREIKYYGVMFNRKSGKIVTTLEHAFSSAMLTMYGLQNTTKTRDFVVFDSNGKIAKYLEGGDFPKVCKDMEGKNIDCLCKGLLEAVTA